MHKTMFLILSFVAVPWVLAVEPLDLELDRSWELVTAPQAQPKWSWQSWRNEQGDLLTVATNKFVWKLTPHDRVMDFASSAHPEWLNTTDFPSWRNEDHAFEPRFLKMQVDTTGGKAKGHKRIPIISYVMVNDHRQHAYMAVGAVVCIGDSTYYIQHNSKRPISDVTVIHSLHRVVSQTSIGHQETTTEP